MLLKVIFQRRDADRIVMRYVNVADRYHLSAEDKQRWLGDGVGLEVRE